MTRCGHCGELGGAQNVCLPASSQVIVTHGGSREEHLVINRCPSAGVLELGMEGTRCPVSLLVAANAKLPAMMRRTRWAAIEQKLGKAYSDAVIAAQEGRVFDSR